MKWSRSSVGRSSRQDCNAPVVAAQLDEAHEGGLGSATPHLLQPFSLCQTGTVGQSVDAGYSASAARRLSAYAVASASSAYLVRGQKKPRRPSLRRLGTT